jgi:hypothetical protein
MHYLGEEERVLITDYLTGSPVNGMQIHWKLLIKLLEDFATHGLQKN